MHVCCLRLISCVCLLTTFVIPLTSCVCQRDVTRYDAAGAAVVGGLEFTVAARGSVPYDSALTQVQAKLHQAMDRALQYVLANYAR